METAAKTAETTSAEMDNHEMPDAMAENAPDHALVWGEIPVRDLDAAAAFYAKALGVPVERREMEPNPLAILPTKDGKGVAAHLYPGKGAGDGTGPTLHLGVDGVLEDAMARWQAAGGQVISPPIAIPMGRFAYCLDLDGNSIGLFGR